MVNVVNSNTSFQYYSNSNINKQTKEKNFAVEKKMQSPDVQEDICTLTFDDIKGIDVENCTYQEFYDICMYARKCITNINFHPSILTLTMPPEDELNTKMNYVERLRNIRDDLGEYGDMQLYLDAQKALSA